MIFMYIISSLKCQKSYNFKKDLNEMRFYTRGTLRGIRISRLAKIPTIYRDWLIYLNKRKGYSFELHRREGRFERHSLYCTK